MAVDTVNVGSYEFNSDDDDGEWSMADETETAKVADMVDPMGDTVPMPDFVRQCVRQVQERLHRNHELELDPAGFYPVPKIGPRSTAPAMSDYRQPRVRFWLPEVDYHVSRPCCPSCRATDGIGIHQWLCRRVVDMTDTYFIVYRRFICTECKDAKRKPYTYGPWDPRVMEQLQQSREDIFEEIGITFTSKNAVTTEVIDYIESHAQDGLSFQKAAGFISAQHQKRCSRLRYRYGLAVKTWRDLQEADFSLEEWGEFGDRNGFCGYIPGLAKVSTKTTIMHNAFQGAAAFRGTSGRGGISRRHKFMWVGAR